jgi:hypothetical protein
MGHPLVGRLMLRMKITDSTRGPWTVRHNPATRPNFCQFSIDGNVIGTSTNRVPNTRMHWLMQTETNLGNPRPVAGQECVLEVDYVALWRYAP